MIILEFAFPFLGYTKITNPMKFNNLNRNERLYHSVFLHSLNTPFSFLNQKYMTYS